MLAEHFMSYRKYITGIHFLLTSCQSYVTYIRILAPQTVNRVFDLQSAAVQYMVGVPNKLATQCNWLLVYTHLKSH